LCLPALKEIRERDLWPLVAIGRLQEIAPSGRSDQPEGNAWDAPGGLRQRISWLTGANYPARGDKSRRRLSGLWTIAVLGLS
jgi:hypothetical protein